MVLCPVCGQAKAALRRPKTGKLVCQSCFFTQFEDEIHETITQSKLFQRGQRVCIGASGGKDSTVLIHVLDLLNCKYDYGLELLLVSVDEGIDGYRNFSLETVRRNEAHYQLPLTIVSYEELYEGWTMDRVVAQIGTSNNCSYCGIFRRQSLDRGARMVKADVIATGHCADDIAEGVLMNILRGDIGRLGRSVNIMTGGASKGMAVPRCKPFKFSYEKEIVMYAYFRKLDYFSTECSYSPHAYRSYPREFLKDLEAIKSSTIIDIIRSGEHFTSNKETTRMPVVQECERCGYMSSKRLCQACVLLAQLNASKAKVGIQLEQEEKEEDKKQEKEKEADTDTARTTDAHKKKEKEDIIPVVAKATVSKGLDW